MYFQPTLKGGNSSDFLNVCYLAFLSHIKKLSFNFGSKQNHQVWLSGSLFEVID